MNDEHEKVYTEPESTSTTTYTLNAHRAVSYERNSMKYTKYRDLPAKVGT